MIPIAAAMALLSVLIAPAVAAQKIYDPGATDNEVKIGNIMAYTGGAEAACFQMVNDRGGVNGRKIGFISVGNGSDAAQSVALARQLVEQYGVLLIFSPIGTDTNLAIRAYMNEKRMPQLFVESSSAVFDDPSHFPGTMGFFATYRTEGSAYAKYILQNKPGAKIAVLYANDDAGKEYLAGVRSGLGDKASAMIVGEVSCQTSDAALGSQIMALKASGAGVFFNLSVAAFLDPAGLEKAKGIIANARSKGWREPQMRSDPAVRAFLEWMRRYSAQASLRDQNNVAGYERAQALVEVLRKCGDDLTRANVMRQAASLDLELGMLRPGIRIRTSPSGYQPIKQLFLIGFSGKDWVPIGPVMGDGSQTPDSRSSP
jgi:hypothetical protein